MAWLPLPVAAAEGAVTAIGWTGRASVQAGERTLQLMVRTRVEPFRRARSTSWLVAAGPASARTMVIEPEGGWVEREGERTPLPPRQARHEREQFGIYGYLLRALEAGPGQGTLTLREPGYPEARFQMDGGGPRAAEYRVSAPEEGRSSIAERFAFSGLIGQDGLRWPRRLTIMQDGRPFFTLEIEQLRIERA